LKKLGFGGSKSLIVSSKILLTLQFLKVSMMRVQARVSFKFGLYCPREPSLYYLYGDSI